MLMQPKKNTISVIMARLKPKGSDEEMSGKKPDEESEEKSESSDTYAEDCAEAADAIMYAIKKSDPQLLSEALLDFLEIAKTKKDEVKEEEY